MDDETVRMVSFAQLSQKYAAYILVYQKEGSQELADRFSDQRNLQSAKEKNIGGIVADMEQKKHAAEELRNNPMMEFENFGDAAEEKKKLDQSQLKKRRPFVRIRHPLTQLVKMKVFATKIPVQKELAENKTTRVSLKSLAKKSQKKTLAWSREDAEAVNELTAMNKFMLGQVERKKDEYDAEYDKGKVKKVKTKKQPQRINFDKQAKRNEKQDQSGEKKFRKRK